MTQRSLFNTKRTAAAAAMVLGLGLPSSGLAWVAINGLDVNPVKKGVVEVVGRAGSGGQQLWCAGGDYMLRVLRIPTSHRFYIYRGRGMGETEHRSNTVQFSVSPPPSGAIPPGISLDMSKVGDNMTIASARAYCDADLDPFWPAD